jgi:hyperosmotically inducible protein
MGRTHSQRAALWIAGAALALGAAPAHAGAISDAWITSKVRFQLISHPGIAPFSIDVKTRDGTVTLAGDVGAQVDKRDAERTAMKVDGVKDVRNELEIKPRTSSG